MTDKSGGLFVPLDHGELRMVGPGPGLVSAPAIINSMHVLRDKRKQSEIVRFSAQGKTGEMCRFGDGR